MVDAFDAVVADVVAAAFDADVFDPAVPALADVVFAVDGFFADVLAADVLADDAFAEVALALAGDALAFAFGFDAAVVGASDDVGVDLIGDTATAALAAAELPALIAPPTELAAPAAPVAAFPAAPAAPLAAFPAAPAAALAAFAAATRGGTGRLTRSGTGGTGGAARGFARGSSGTTGGLARRPTAPLAFDPARFAIRAVSAATSAAASRACLRRFSISGPPLPGLRRGELLQSLRLGRGRCRKLLLELLELSRRLLREWDHAVARPTGQPGCRPDHGVGRDRWSLGHVVVTPSAARHHRLDR